MATDIAFKFLKIVGKQETRRVPRARKESIRIVLRALSS